MAPRQPRYDTHRHQDTSMARLPIGWNTSATNNQTGLTSEQRRNKSWHGKTQLKRSTPEPRHSSSAIRDFVQAVEQHTHPLDAVQGFMLLRHGSVVAEGWWNPYSSQSPHSLYSLSKSFTSTAIGLAVAEGRLTVDDPVLKFFPEDAPSNPGENLMSMRVWHLLSMNTGHRGYDRHVQDRLITARAFYRCLSAPDGTCSSINRSHYILSASSTTQGDSYWTLRRGCSIQWHRDPKWETDRAALTAGERIAYQTEDIARVV